MDSKNTKFETIQEYHAQLPAELKPVAEQVYSIIKAAAPEATECISYGMPSFKGHKVLIHYAIWKEHVGLYPLPSGMVAFDQELSQYKSGKGSVQLPLDQPLPEDLITRIVQYRVQQDAEEAAAKKAKKK